LSDRKLVSEDGTYGEGEMGEILKEDGHGVAEVCEFECTNVFAVEKNLALLWVV
jgi:hypothetical protein